MKARQLPAVTIGGKKYFVDVRLNELRNVSNPHDKESAEGMSVAFWQRIASEHVQ